MPPDISAPFGVSIYYVHYCPPRRGERPRGRLAIYYVPFLHSKTCFALWASRFARKSRAAQRGTTIYAQRALRPQRQRGPSGPSGVTKKPTKRKSKAARRPFTARALYSEGPLAFAPSGRQRSGVLRRRLYITSR